MESSSQGHLIRSLKFNPKFNGEYASLERLIRQGIEVKRTRLRDLIKRVEEVTGGREAMAVEMGGESRTSWRWRRGSASRRM
ncbi:hypothetical protein M5689_012649 [Euphorbia peplus]|nr:hypothetical protein M5689_012649 [Euphorbia peplus]